jgi:oxygen-independent coproporphyrinogen-3 oxidase
LPRSSKRIEAAFDLGSLDEHAIELDPRVVDRQLAADLKAYGVTRVSLGVQDLNARVQQAIGRVQPLEVVEGALNALRGAGLDAINMDVMYGLPHQSLEDVVRSVTACAAIGRGQDRAVRLCPCAVDEEEPAADR